MPSRLITILLLSLLAALLAIVQFSFIQSLPSFWAAINLPLLIITAALFFFGRDTAIIFAFILGLSIDILSFLPFGFYLIIFQLTVFCLHLLLKNLLTNRSFYSFSALMLASVSVVNALSIIADWLFLSWRREVYIFLPAHTYFWQDFAGQLLWALIFSVLLFNLMNGLSQRFKPFFLADSKK